MSERKQNFISKIETTILKILPFGYAICPLVIFIIGAWLVIAYDWSTFLTVFLMLILGILSRVGLSVLIVNLTNRLAANDKWVFPTDGLHAFYKENPEKSVDDGICHILEEEQVSGKYWRKYRGNADIRKMVDDIRKPIYNEYKEAEAAKERARLAEKMKNWEQEAAKYTKYANRKGKEKSIQYCKDRIAYYNKVLGNYSPENMSKARGEMMDLSNKIYKSTAQREHDWALHGGIAEGIAGTAAGVATALNIQRENAQIRSQNAALGKRIGDMNVAYMQALDEQKTILNGCLRRWKENLKTAQETTIKQEDQKKLMEILAPKVSSVFVENELHVLKVWIKADCTSYNISKSLSKIGYEHAGIDGSIKMTIEYNGKVIGTPIGVMAFGGTAYSEHIVATCKIPNDVNIPYEETKKVKVTFEPRDLWVVQNAHYEVYSDRNGNYDFIREIEAYE